MTERTRLTDALVLAARPREREYAIHDTAPQGFMLRIQPNGARSWVFRFRRDGSPRRVTLGKPEAVRPTRRGPPHSPSSRARRAAGVPCRFPLPARR